MVFKQQEICVCRFTSLKRRKLLVRKIAVYFAIVLLATCLAACGKGTPDRPATQETMEITDMIGRKVTVPKKINKVYGNSPIAKTLVFSFDPTKEAGQYKQSVNPTQNSTEKSRKIPDFSGMFVAHGVPNLEKILQASPDVILSVTMTGIDENGAGENADRMQDHLRIPVVVVCCNLLELDKTYTFMGELLGEQARGEELANYCRDTIAGIGAMVRNIPEDKRVRVYYAKGETGLETDPQGSRHSEVLDFVRGINVAQAPPELGSGPMAVSFEKVMLWNPDVIIANNAGKSSGGFVDSIKTDDRWANIRAVKEHRVFVIPNQPFSWFSQPPSVNRLIGIKWLANLLYPEYVKLDIKNEAKQLYKLFYHYEPTDQEIANMLRNSLNNF
jgi:iron complex transport system substrate-binding protein